MVKSRITRADIARVRENIGLKWKARHRINPVIKTYVQRVVDRATEDKMIQHPLVSTFSSVANSWTEYDIVNVPQDVTGTGRIGRRIKVKSLEIRGVLASGADETAADDPYNVVRIVVGRYQPQVTAPLGTESMTIDSVITTRTGREFLKHKYVDKYVPLTVAGTEKGGGDGYTPGLKQFKYFKRFKHLYINWGDNTQTYPSERLIMSMISDSTAIPNPGFINGYICLRYEDA